MVTLGTGIGAGIITSGRLLHGAQGFAGEPGHMVVDPNGPPCPCGKRGCWERFASGSGLGRLARDAASGGRLDAAVALAGGDPEAVRGEHVTASARAGDVESQAVLDELARWIALGLANLVNVLDPALIVIGGGLVEAADLLLPPGPASLCRPGDGRRSAATDPDRPRPARRPRRRHRRRPAGRRAAVSAPRRCGLASASNTRVSFRDNLITTTGGTLSPALRRAIAVSMILLLSAAACGNSGDDDVVTHHGERRRGRRWDPRARRSATPSSSCRVSPG